MYKKNHPAFTIIELLIAIIVMSILTITLLQSYKHYSGINSKAISNKSFTEYIAKITDVIKDKQRLHASMIAPQGVVALNTLYNNKGIVKDTYDLKGVDSIEFKEPLPNDSKFIYKNSKYFFNKGLEISMDDLLAVSKDGPNTEQLRFLGLLDLDSDASNIKLNNSQSKYLLLITNRESETRNGFKFQYKIFTFVDLGSNLFNKLKQLGNNNAGKSADISIVISTMLKRTEFGFAANIGKVEEGSHTITALKKIFKNLTDKEVIDLWYKARYDIKVANISTEKDIRNMLEVDIANISDIAKNMSDWALTQARIAAYDSISGNSLDKDYFITCVSEGNGGGNQGCEFSYINKDGDEVIAKLDPLKTLLPNKKYSNTKARDLQGDSNNGFFICESDGHGQCLDDIDAKPETTYNISNLKLLGNSIFVDSAIEIDRTKKEAKGYILAPGTRNLLGATKKTKNNFNLPIFFCNNGIYHITNSYSIGGSEEIKFTSKLNKPRFTSLPDDYANPPYISEIFTIFPHFIGGKDKNINDDSLGIDIDTSSDFGIYRKTIFAHIF